MAQHGPPTDPGLTASRPGSRGAARAALVGAVAVATVLGAGVPAFAQPPAGHSSSAGHGPQGAQRPELGPNVVVFTPDMTTADIQARVDDIYAEQVDNEMGRQRYALLFMPGTYGSESAPLDVKVGYYTEVDGLGQNPGDVTINGTVTATGRNGVGALDTFWRSVSNLTINHSATLGADGGPTCETGNEMWAVSQAAPMRRVKVNGFTTFMPYCTNPNYASGGFVADSVLTGGALNGSQQQFYVRNTDLGDGWSNPVWNQVFSGDVNAPADNFVAGGPYYTTLATTPVSKEKPYLYVDASGDWNVFVPSLQHNSSGATWADGPTPGRSIPLRDFYIATPGDQEQSINAALARGQNLLFTPGVYDIGRTLSVRRPDTVVLGLGMATLTAQDGVTVLRTADVPGIDIAGLTIDAGPVNSNVLVKIGSDRGGWGWRGFADRRLAEEPTALQDVFFRIGGPHVGKATTSIVVNADNTLLDDLWIWRADHGVPGSFGWDVNTADHGLIVNGDHVTATGLFVEHFQKEDVIWNGENGVDVFFQNETPYDPPSQSAWDQPGPNLGYPAFKVADDVRHFHGYGMGSYVVQNQTDASVYATEAYQAPVRDGVQLTHIETVFIVGNGGYRSVIDGVGGAATASTGVGVPVVVPDFPS